MEPTGPEPFSFTIRMVAESRFQDWASAFADFDAGKRIFEGWIKRVGHRDEFEEIRASIVEGPISGKPDGYTVFDFIESRKHHPTQTTNESGLSPRR
jgi:hypothetical protein